VSATPQERLPESIPTGTVTFVFTDIEGSTERWDRNRAAMQAAVRRHDELMRAAITESGGYVFKTIGDAFCAAFARPADALTAVLSAQMALAAEDFSAIDGLRVRAAIHTGTADERDGDYFGPAVNRVARLLGIAHGGQVLVSATASDLLEGSLPPHVSLRDLGEHRLKDLSQAEHVRQLVAPDLPAEFPPLRSLNTLANNLPLQVTSFVGREAEVAKILALLADHRLVTIVGSGGVGKTRASLQVAANSVDGSGGGVWFIELAPLSSGEYIPATIAQALGVTLGSGDPIAQLVAALKSKRMLLVLDNCEHLIDAAARVVSALLVACPQIAILASSRQELGIVGEATYRMPSLPVPREKSDGVATTSALTADDARRFSSIALFVERAQAVSDRFELTDDNAPAIADICRRLDGIALAIELAAARVTILSPQQLRGRLDERFRVLTGGGRDRWPRQQTLRALIDWSYDLLDEREKVLFRRLGIFVNGFTLEAASAVGGGDELDEFEVLDLVASLTQKSLVIAEPQGSTIRYYLLESTRAYAAEKLVEAGEREAVARRHLRYFRDWLTRVEREAYEFRSNRVQAFAMERDDIRFALDGALSGAELTDGAELLAVAGGAWIAGGLQQEGIARLKRVVEALPASASTRLLAKLGTALTDLYVRDGRFREAGEAATEAVRFARISEDTTVLAHALIWYAWARKDDFDAAEAAVREAEAIANVPPILQIQILELGATLSMDAGDLDVAAQSFERLRDQWRLRGNRRNEAVNANNLAEVEFRRGRYQRAADLWREAIELVRHENEPLGRTEWLVCLGSTLAVSGDTAAATGAAIEALTYFGHTEPEHTFVTQAIELLAYLAAERGNIEYAASLAGYANANLVLGGSQNLPVTIRRRLTTLLQDKLASDDLAKLKAEGMALTPGAAIALAQSLGPRAAT
jgi:predicted ATPase/class 3 adenylate cyclase